jgi:low temperature requirement protein LtrA
VQRGLTLLQMFAVAVMAANAKDALDSRSSAGFAAAYAAVRLVLVGQYLRARHIVEARPLTTRYLMGHGFAAILWLLSALIPAPERFWIWAIAFAIDLGTPWLAIPHSVRIPPDAAHLPERFGLFMLILLGESVVAVMHGMESQENWPVSAAVSAFMGMGLFFTIWWWYFDGAAGASEQPVRTKRDAIRFHVWTYAHFPLYLGTVIAGVGVQRIVTLASHAQLTSTDALMLGGGVATVMLAITVIDFTSARSRPHIAARVAPHVTLAVATFFVGGIGHRAAPVLMMVVIVAFSLGQLAWALGDADASANAIT